jgi:SAM-dependent methyltransferase
MNWYDDLCDYYNVTPQEAINLGIRRTGRKPNLPSSITCKAVSGRNFEELWDMKSRETIQEKMDFYKDIGSWQVFRQCNYRHDFNYGKLYFPYLSKNSSIVEYGCGVAPLTNYIIEHANYLDITCMSFSLVDVAGEHLEFAKWRLHKKAPNVCFDFHEITSDYMIPKFNRKFDIICIMDVFEHLPNPLEVMTNLWEHSNFNCFLVETWREGKSGGPDLLEAEEQRNSTLQFINEHYNKIKDGSIRTYLRK